MSQWEIVDYESIEESGYEYEVVDYYFPFEYTSKALSMFLGAGVKTNIHYVLSTSRIDDAIRRLKESDFPEGINAVIFLLHKPVGMGGQEDVLSADDPRVKEFFALVDEGGYPFKVGFDSCTVPGIINYTKDISTESIDTCEGGRWSMYISADMIAVPCSFDQAHEWGFDLIDRTIQEAWDSDQFEKFRDHFKYSCVKCKDRLSCMSGCPIRNEVVLCARKERDWFSSVTTPGGKPVDR